MKKIILSIVTLGVLGIMSCTSDPCKDKSATTQCNGKGVLVANGSSCDCQCDAGYTGTDCATLLSSVFVGSYSCVEVGDKSGSSSYVATMTPNTSSVEKMNIKNLWNQFVNNANFSISGSNITMSLQEPDADKFFVQNGTGTWSKNASGKVVIKINYEVVDNTGSSPITDKVTATWTQL